MLFSTTSTVQDLQTELLERIFFFCLDYPATLPSVQRAPWSLGLVCRRWRQISFHTPHLWANLPPLNYTTVSRFQRAWRLFTYYLEKSLAAPLTLRLSLAQDLPPPEHLSVLGTSERWYDLSLNVPFKSLQYFQTIQDNLPLLHTLQLHITHPDLPAEESAQGIFQVLPNLRELVLLVPSPAIRTSLNLPFPQLTRFVGNYFNAQDTLELLSLIPNLVECCLTVDPKAVASRVGCIPVELQHLRIFALYSSSLVPDTIGFSVFLAELTLPSLAELYIQGDGNVDLPAITSLLVRSACTLTHLSLHEVKHANVPEQLASLLSWASHLELLDIDHSSPADLAVLHQRYSGALLVPNLRHLTIRRPNAGCAASFKAIIATRCSGGADQGLQRLRVTYSHMRLCEIEFAALTDRDYSRDSIAQDLLQHCDVIRQNINLMTFTRHDFKLEVCNEVEAMFQAYESTYIDPAHILYAGLHRALRRLMLMHPKHPMWRNPHRFGFRAARLLGRWSGDMERYLATPKWFIHRLRASVVFHMDPVAAMADIWSREDMESDPMTPLFPSV